MRPLGVGEILDAAVNLYFRDLRTLLAVAAVVAVPLFALIFALDAIALQEVGALEPDAAAYRFGDAELVLDESTFLLISIVEAVLSAIGYLLVIGACFRAVSDIYAERATGPRESVAFAARRLPTLLWFGLLWAGGVALGLLLLVIPGIILIVVWSVAIPALMVERLGAVKALGRSFRLTQDNWWRTFGALIVGFVFIALIGLILGFTTQAFGAIAEDSPLAFAALYDAANGLSMIITAPLQAAIVTVIYYDLRVRKEGYGGQHLTEPPGGEVPPGVPPPGSGQVAPPPGWAPVPTPGQSPPPPPASGPPPSP